MATTGGEPAARGRYRGSTRVRRPWLVPLVMALVASGVGGAFLINARATRDANAQPRVIDFSGEAMVDGGSPPFTRLPTGARLRCGASGRMRLQWDDGTLLDVGNDVTLAIDGPGKHLRLGQGAVGALVSPQPAGLPLRLSMPYGEVRCQAGRFTCQVEPRWCVVRAQVGSVQVQGQGGAKQRLDAGEAVQLPAAAEEGSPQVVAPMSSSAAPTHP